MDHKEEQTLSGGEQTLPRLAFMLELEVPSELPIKIGRDSNLFICMDYANLESDMGSIPVSSSMWSCDIAPQTNVANKILVLSSGRGCFGNDYNLDDCYNDLYEELGLSLANINASLISKCTVSEICLNIDINFKDTQANCTESFEDLTIKTFGMTSSELKEVIKEGFKSLQVVDIDKMNELKSKLSSLQNTSGDLDSKDLMPETGAEIEIAKIQAELEQVVQGTVIQPTKNINLEINLDF